MPGTSGAVFNPARLPSLPGGMEHRLDVGPQALGDGSSDKGAAHLVRGRRLSGTLGHGISAMTTEVRILLIEDRDENRAQLVSACRRQHIPFAIDPYPTVVGVKALQKAKRDGRIPDLVVLDIDAPRLKAVDILRFLREDAAFRAVVVIVLSGSLLPEDRAACAAADRFFIRPGSFDGWINIVLFMRGYAEPQRMPAPAHSTEAAPDVHLLHVDDDHDDRALFALAFARSRSPGFLHQVDSVAEALLFLNRLAPHQQARRPALIVLDLEMPGVDGRELLRILRGNTRFQQIPIVVLTGSESFRDMERCRDLLIEDYVNKPRTPQEMNEFIMSLRRWLCDGKMDATIPVSDH
jgi:CheY-like chemotaxis protein